MLNNLLLYRILILNACGTAGVVWAWQRGFLDYIDKDTSGISYVILAIWALGMVSIIQRVLKVSIALNKLKTGQRVEINPAKFVAKGAHLEFIMGTCISLGFFGTVVGIIMMLFGGGGIVSDGSLDSVKAIIERIMSGGGVAFITTAVGLATSMWLEVNVTALNTATALMLEDSSHA